MLYTGTFEAYQGVDLLIEAAAIVARSHPHARVLVVGGEPAQVEAARAEAAAAGAAEAMIFTGQQPAREIPAFVQACDVLVSPRQRARIRRSRSTHTFDRASPSSPPIC